MKGTHIRIVVIIGSIAIAGIIVFQLYWFNKAWRLNVKSFNQTMNIALSNVAKKIYDFNKIEPPLENPVNQMSSNYFIVNINSEIDANVLEYYLKNEFEKSNITLDYEYGIYDCYTNKMLYGNYISSTESFVEADTTKALPTYDKYVYYFGVNFPKMKSYIFSELSIWAILSSILLLAIFFFAYTIFIILKQKRLSEQQKEFINNMTHEFKTPISSINISADVLLDPSSENDKERISGYARIIKQENKRLNQQVERVLNIARIEKTGFNLKYEQIDLHEVIKEVAASFQSNKKNLEVHLKLEAETNTIRGDKLHLTNIIFNLMDNAIKYSQDDPEIIISTWQESYCLVLSVQDNGIGIKKEYLKKVFHKFYRVPTGNIHDVKGFGLGLYYIKNICLKHQWKIRLESEPGKGTKFYIFVPLK
jgi:two-component system, OmpR family, phosphate regulon sensor histidine kinase PhoR